MTAPIIDNTSKQDWTAYIYSRYPLIGHVTEMLSVQCSRTLSDRSMWLKCNHYSLMQWNPVTPDDITLQSSFLVQLDSPLIWRNCGTCHCYCFFSETISLISFLHLFWSTNFVFNRFPLLQKYESVCKFFQYADWVV